jgi:protein-tyrosine phosphatase
VQEGRIYRSGQLHPALIERMLREHNISVIVDLTNDRHPEPFQVAEAETAKSLGIEHRHYPLKGDGTGNIRQYAAAIARIHQASLSNQPVLVHCAAGSQRTGGVIASYRLFVEHAPTADVLKEMEQYDWDPVKDRVLLDYLNKHMKELADLLVKEGVIDAPPDPLPVLAP